MAAPSAEAESVTVESGKTTTGNFTLSHLHNGLSYCYANITIDDRSVGEFEVGGIRFYDGFTGGYVSYPYFTNLYISASPNLTGPIDEIPVVQLTYGGISPGSTLINVTELELYDANGTRYPTVQDYPGLLTVTDPLVQKPVITNLNPAGCQQNSHSGPFPVIITGTGFDTVSGTNNVTVDGSVVPYFVDSPTRINATFPEIVDNTLGSHPVIVKGISGSSAPHNFVVSGKGFTIDASSDEIGWINPSGVFSIDPGTSLSFTFKPTAGARIKNLTVNGVEQSTVSPFVIPSVDKDYTIRLNNEPLPGVIIAAFTVESDDGYTVTFNDKSWGEPNQWKWDFGDGSVGTGNPVSHSYSTPGSCSVSLWVRSDLSQSQVVIGDIVIPMPGEVGLLTFGP